MTYSPLQEMMLRLDMALTGNDDRKVRGQLHHYPATLEKWITQDHGCSNPVWYLSDGGYSRVVWSLDTKKLFLTYNSRAAVVARWDETLPLREEIEAYLTAEYAKLEAASQLATALLEDNDAGESAKRFILRTRTVGQRPTGIRFEIKGNQIKFTQQNGFTAALESIYTNHEKSWLFTGIDVTDASRPNYKPAHMPILLGDIIEKARHRSVQKLYLNTQMPYSYTIANILDNTLGIGRQDTLFIHAENEFQLYYRL
jgi:hypothetical protein